MQLGGIALVSYCDLPGNAQAGAFAVVDFLAYGVYSGVAPATSLQFTATDGLAVGKHGVEG